MSELHEHQQINLLDRGFRRAAAVLPVRQLAALFLAAVAGLTAYYFAERSRLEALEQRVAHLEADYSQQQAGVKRSGDRAREGADLDRRIARLTAERRAKGHVLNLLAGRAVGNTDGFSAYLEGLARQTQSGVWLRRIAIRGGGNDLTLAGSALDPKLVPRYLKRLSAQAPYKGTAFRTFKMSRRTDAGPSVDFAVGTAGPQE